MDILRIFRAWFSFLAARAHLVPNQGSSGLALVSRLKLDRLSLMGIRVEFETKCQCLYWSLIKSLRKQILKICSFIVNPFLGDKRWVGFGTNCFLPPDLALTDRPATGRLLICCSSLSKGGRGSQKILEAKNNLAPIYLAQQNICNTNILICFARSSQSKNIMP